MRDTRGYYEVSREKCYSARQLFSPIAMYTNEIVLIMYFDRVSSAIICRIETLVADCFRGTDIGRRLNDVNGATNSK